MEFPDNGRATEDERKRKREELDEKYAPESTHGWWRLSQPINNKESTRIHKNPFYNLSLLKLFDVTRCAKLNDC